MIDASYDLIKLEAKISFESFDSPYFDLGFSGVDASQNLPSLMSEYTELLDAYKIFFILFLLQKISYLCLQF